MNRSFGPWATAIDTGCHPQLSRFWRRRLTRLRAVVEDPERYLAEARKRGFWKD